MAIQTIYEPSIQVADGTAGPYSIPFNYLNDPQNIQIFAGSTLQIFGTDYTFDVDNNIVFEVDHYPANGVILTISLVLDDLQSTSFERNGPFPSAAVENALDKLTLMIQTVESAGGGSIDPDTNLIVNSVTAIGGFTGPLTGNVTGNVTGDVTGDLTGDVTGDVTGNLTGDVTGNLTGDVNATDIDTVDLTVTGTINAAAINIASEPVATEEYVNNAVSSLPIDPPLTLDASAGLPFGEVPLKVITQTDYNQGIVVVNSTLASSNAISNRAVQITDVDLGNTNYLYLKALSTEIVRINNTTDSTYHSFSTDHNGTSILDEIVLNEIVRIHRTDSDGITIKEADNSDLMNPVENYSTRYSADSVVLFNVPTPVGDIDSTVESKLLFPTDPGTVKTIATEDYVDTSISDLNLGTAAQSDTTDFAPASLSTDVSDIETELSGYGDIVTHDASEFASASHTHSLSEITDVTASAAEVNLLDGVTASTAELNILDGATLTTSELNYVDGVTSSIQNQLDGKQVAGSYQPLDAQLTDVASLTPTNDGVIIGNGTNFVVESGATLKTSLGLTIGTDVQAYDATNATSASTNTFTNKTFDADGTGNSITNIEDADIKSGAAIALNKLAATTISRALVSDGSGFVSPATTTATEIGYVNGVTSSIQAQLNTCLSKNYLPQGEISVNPNSVLSVRNLTGLGTAHTWIMDGIALCGFSAARFTVTKSTDVPSVSGKDIKSSLRLAVTTADASIAAGDTNSLRLCTGHANALILNKTTMTLSFWVKTTITGIYCVSFRFIPGTSNSSVGQSYVTEYTVNSSDTWEYKTITVPTAANYTTAIKSLTGLVVSFVLVGGTTAQTTAGSWQALSAFNNVQCTSNQVNGVSSTSNNILFADIILQTGLNDKITQPTTVSMVRQHCFPMVQGGSFKITSVQVGATVVTGMVPWPYVPENPIAGQVASEQIPSGDVTVYDESFTSGSATWTSTSNVATTRTTTVPETTSSYIRLRQGVALDYLGSGYFLAARSANVPGMLGT